ncbi:hypothetical protein [Paraburkholderia acidisoli]|uniref:Uncharacterized protein n=1 Tax=Paraburkholderia acidisoli TaxID=2571748 RepID=A0A7Z2GSR2_9BURK|nr:hypothetical protein [Paraburkholderia acidisoli]QGZ67060.1 hypothetical protein FAZ98_35110 [Paraburkholderia acidisoli]
MDDDRQTDLTKAFEALAGEMQARAGKTIPDALQAHLHAFFMAGAEVALTRIFNRDPANGWRIEDIVAANATGFLMLTDLQTMHAKAEANELILRSKGKPEGSLLKALHSEAWNHLLDVSRRIGFYVGNLNAYRRVTTFLRESGTVTDGEPMRIAYERFKDDVPRNAQHAERECLHYVDCLVGLGLLDVTQREAASQQLFKTLDDAFGAV